VRDGADGAGEGVDGLRAGLINLAAAVQLAQVGIQAFGAALQALRIPAQLAIDFERQFALVATLSDKVGADLERGLLELAGRVPQTAGDITQATYQAISAGIDVDSVVDFLDAASKAAVAGNSTLTTSVEALTTAVNAFESQGVTAARASDVLFATVKAGVTTFEELNASLGQASAVAAYGVSIEEVGAAVASLTKLGFSTADAITRINGAVKAIANPVGSAATQFKRLGIEVGIDRLQAVGLAGVLADVQKATGGSASQIAKLTNRFEAQQGLLGLLGTNYEGFEDNLRSTGAAAGSTDAAFEKLSNTTQGAIDRFKSTAEGALRELGDAILPAINEAAESLNATLTTEGPAMIKALADIAKGFAAIVGPAGNAAAAAARFFNLVSGGSVRSAQNELDARTSSLLEARSRVFAFGRGVNPADIARSAGSDEDAQRQALEEFASSRAADVEARRAEIARRLQAAQAKQAENAVVLARTGGLGPLGRAAARKAEELQQEAEAIGEEFAAVNKARLLLRDIVENTLDNLEAKGGGGGGGFTPDNDPKPPKRRAPIDEGPTLFDAFGGAVNRGLQVALAGAGQGLDYIAAQAAEREAAQARNEQLLAIGSDLAERRLALVEDESTRRLAQLSLRHQQELEAIGEFEEQRTELLAVQAAERERLEQQTSRAIRESVARDSAATLGSLADLGEAFGAAGSIVSTIRATALAADAIYFGIKGAGYQAEAIGAFATLNVPQGLALQAAAIKHFAQSALAAKGAIQLGASAAAGGGGGGGGALGASRAQTDSRRDGRVAASREQQAPSLTIVLSDAVAISDRPEIIRPMVASFAQELRRQMNTRGGTRLPAAG
jgi:TP901 family phage tail tape measure protein